MTRDRPHASPQLGRILCVEDEPDIREVVKITLEAVGGYEVEVCADGAEALTQVPAWKPDLILLDVMMPNLDGPATLEALRSAPRTARIPVVFMTAKTQPQDIERFAALGVAGVVSKPFDPMDLPAEIESLWARHQAGVNDE